MLLTIRATTNNSVQGKKTITIISKLLLRIRDVDVFSILGTLSSILL